MRGAVLSELGLKIGEVRMRRHYGVVVYVPFIDNKHPTSLKFVHHDGLTYCNSVLIWFAKLVCILVL